MFTFRYGVLSHFRNHMLSLVRIEVLKRIGFCTLTSDSAVFVYLLFIKSDLPTHSHNRIANLHAGDLCSFLSTPSVEGKDYGARYVF